VRRVLIVDDEPSSAIAAAELLRFAGYDVATEPNGRAALAAMRRRRPDLLLLDYMMPVLDGVQTLTAMRADAALSDLPVLLMSAAAERSIPRHAPWNAFLRKPFREPALAAALAAVLAKR
jgi:CheY-like chemotaxis protein